MTKIEKLKSRIETLKGCVQRARKCQEEACDSGNKNGELEKAIASERRSLKELAQAQADLEIEETRAAKAEKIALWNRRLGGAKKKLARLEYEHRDAQDALKAQQRTARKDHSAKDLIPAFQDEVERTSKLVDAQHVEIKRIEKILNDLDPKQSLAAAK